MTRETVKSVHILLESLVSVHQAERIDELLRSLTGALTPLYGPAYVALLTRDHDGPLLRLPAFIGPDGPVFNRLRVAGAPLPEATSPSTLASLLGTPAPGDLPVIQGRLKSVMAGIWTERTAAIVEEVLAAERVTLATIPGHGGAAGILAVLTGRGCPDRTRRVAAMHGAAGAATVLRRREVQRLAGLDPATLVLDRHALRAAAARELQRAARFKQPMAILLIEVPAAETGGAEARLAAERLVRALRRSDVVGRLSDRLFGVILPETSRSGAQIAEVRLRRGFGADGVAIQIAIATSPGDGSGWRELLDTASARLPDPTAAPPDQAAVEVVARRVAG